jgi:hypothetical protein
MRALNMRPSLAEILILLCLVGVPLKGEVPASGLNPFQGGKLQAIRTITRAESSAGTAELSEAWDIYNELKGSWMPGAHKPAAVTIARLDRLKAKLERIPGPPWFVDDIDPRDRKDVQIAERVGDSTFKAQKATVEYQSMKALAIVYLTEHELDRPDSANNAGKFLSILVQTHPWDWETHALFSRLLIDAGQSEPGWLSAIQSIFLNPGPNLEDLKYFAFVGKAAGKAQWSEIQAAIREAAPDGGIAEQAIRVSAPLFDSETKVTNVPQK